MSGLFWIIFAFFIWLLPYFILIQKIQKIRNNQNYIIDKINDIEQKIRNQPLDPEAAHTLEKIQSQSIQNLESFRTSHKDTNDVLNTTQIHPSTTHPTPAPPPLPLQQRTAPISSQPEQAKIEPDEQSTSVVTSVWITISHWFSGGNTIVRIGVLVLLIGIVLLLRLLNDHISLPIELWLGLIGVAAIGLIGIGLRLRSARYGYAISLQGAGFAILYLTLFSAYHLYAVLSSQITFGLLAILASITTGLSLRQNALPLAVLGFGAAFFAPILTSTTQPQVVLLFSYYLLINIAVAWIAHRRTWKILNLIGATATFGMASVWGWQAFDPTLRWPLELLLIAHVALYVFVVVRYSQILAQQSSTAPTTSSLKSLVGVDSGLLFAVPLVGFGLQAGLMQGIPYALALSSAVLGAFYLGLAGWLQRQALAVPLLREGILALGMVFLALVVPLALNAEWTSTGWLLQGLGLVWVGVRQARPWQVFFGLALQAMSLIILAWLWLTNPEQQFSLELLIAFASVLFAAALLRQPMSVAPVAALLASKQTADTGNPNLVTFTEASTEIQTETAPATSLQFGSIFLIVLSYVIGVWLLQDLWSNALLDSFPQLSTLDFGVQLGLDVLLLSSLGVVLSIRMIWPEMRWIMRWMSLLSGLCLVVLLWQMPEDLLLTAITLAIASVFWLILQLGTWWHLSQTATNQTVTHPPSDKTSSSDQSFGLLLILALLSLWSMQLYMHAVTVVLMPVALLLLLQWRKTTEYLPVWLPLQHSQHRLYPLLALFFAAWIAWANVSASGQFAGMPYLPLLSMLDICLIAVGLWLYRGMQIYIDGFSSRSSKITQLALGGLMFWSLSGVVVRSLHQWVDTPLWPSAWYNDTVQTSLTIVWSSTALLITILASRQALRPLWWVGIGLLVMVTSKLLLVDLSNLSAIARVVSFIGAGGLMLVIGYVAPLPPPPMTAANKDANADQH